MHRDVCEDYGFRFLENVEKPAVKLLAVGKQEISSGQYDWDNRNREACYLFQYTFSGSGTLRTGEQLYTLRQGDAFFLKMPEEERYYFDEGKNEAPWKFIYVMFEGEAVQSYYEYVIGRAGKVLHLDLYHPAVNVLQELHEKAKEGLLSNAFEADSEVFRFLCLLCLMDTEEKKNTLVDRAKAYIEKNYAVQMTLAQAAEALGISQSHLSREFVRITGEQPIHYLTKVRLEHATRLLRTTEADLNEISRQCGFSDGNYFCKVFRRYMKISPGELRKQIRAYGYSSFRV